MRERSDGGRGKMGEGREGVQCREGKEWKEEGVSGGVEWIMELTRDYSVSQHRSHTS